MANILFFGFGYSAKFIAESFPNYYDFIATKRNDKSFINFIYPNHIAEINFDNIDVIISSIPPQEDGDPVILSYKEQLKQLPKPVTIIYLSASNVYGNHQGKVINESAELKAKPGTKGFLRIKAEEQWQKLQQVNNHINLVILRLSSIYGPYRSSLSYIKQKNEIIYQPHKLFNRIHVEDIAEIIKQIIVQKKTNEIYNLCDDHPAPLHENYQYAANLLNIEIPKLVSLEQSSASITMKEFFQKHYILSNCKIINDLCYKLRYASYKDGLKHIFEQECY
jgi:nucleoside-diphosphate-sugar epimerase